MRAGSLRHCFVFESNNSTTQNQSGEIAPTWTTDFEVRGEDMPEGGREFFDAQQRISEITHLFRIRHRPGVTAKQRITFDGKVFNILAAWNPDGKKIELLIAVKERLPAETK